MEKYLALYHGSQKLITKPRFREGKKNNDFGYGFYCTLDNESAKEWAVSSLNDGISNMYLIDIKNLNILYLNSPKYTILNWIAVLVENRLFNLNNPVANKARKYLIDNFGININSYDIIIGYRADDSYYDYAKSFINNSITVEQLSKAMQLGKLVEQIVIKSEYAFSKLEFKGFEIAYKEKYYPLKKKRNDAANKKYLNILEEENDGLYIQDIIRGGIKNDDPRIPKNIC